MKSLLIKFKQNTSNLSRRPSLSRRKKKGKNNNAPFPFLQLPREIRDQIYLYVFGNQAVQIIPHGDSKLTYSRCSWINPPAASRYLPWSASTFPDPWKVWDSPESHDQGSEKLQTSTLYACRQTYNESSQVLYSAICFQADEVQTWLRFACSINSKHLAMVKSLRTCWVALACLTEAPVPPEQKKRYAKYENYTTLSDGGFQEFWSLPATKMTGLVDLGFVMEYTGHYLSRSTSAMWVDELLKVKGLGKFELEIWDMRSKQPRTQEATDEEMASLRQYLRDRMCAPRRAITEP